MHVGQNNGQEKRKSNGSYDVLQTNSMETGSTYQCVCGTAGKRAVSLTRGRVRGKGNGRFCRFCENHVG